MKTYLLKELITSCNSMTVIQRCLKFFSKIDAVRCDKYIEGIIDCYILAAYERLVDFPKIAFKMACVASINRLIQPTKYSIILKAVSPLLNSDFFDMFNEDKSGK